MIAAGIVIAVIATVGIADLLLIKGCCRLEAERGEDWEADEMEKIYEHRNGSGS